MFSFIRIQAIIKPTTIKRLPDSEPVLFERNEKIDVNIKQ